MITRNNKRRIHKLLKSPVFLVAIMAVGTFFIGQEIFHLDLTPGNDRVGQVAGAQTGTWTQTDWSGGANSGGNTTDEYDSATDIDSSVSGSFALPVTSGWSTDYANWLYRKEIVFDNTDATLGVTTEDLIDFPVLIKLDSGVNIDYSITKDSGEDIRFTDNDGTVLSYEIEDWNESGSSFVWVKVPQIDANSNTDKIYMYYGNGLAADAQDPSSVWSNNYAMVQHLKNNTTSNVKDSTTNAYIGTKRIVNGPTEIIGKIGKAQQFGSNDYIDLGNILNPGTNSFTVEIWFRRQTNGSANGSILYNKESLYETAAGGGYSTYAWQPHWAWDGAGTALFSLNQWTKSTIVFDHVNQYMYLNGVQKYSRAQTGNVGTNTARLQIGARGDTGHSSFFVGDIDEMRVSMVARSGAWLAAAYKSDEATFNTFETAENKFPTSGTLTSNIYDSGFASDWGNVSYTKTGNGTASVKVRSDSNSDMSTASSWSSCSAVISASDLTDSNCVDDEDRYIQYQVTLTAIDATSPVFESISMDYSASDQVAPTTNASSVTNPKEDEWTNIEQTFAWTAGADDVGGNGLLGYCIAIDGYDINATSNILDPAITAGILAGKDDGVTETYCPYIVTGTSLDLSSISNLTLTTGNYYSISIKAVDLAGNIFNGSSTEYQDLSKFKYDNTAPVDPGYLSLPGNFVSTKEVTFIWPTSGPDAPHDDDSGFLGIQYRIGTNGIWYGDLHLGTEDENDLLVNDGAYTTDPTYDYTKINEGSNKIYIRTFDNAGNVTDAVTEKTVLKVNTIAPSAVNNLSVTPTNNTVNAYTFTWNPPTTYTGQASNLIYCYSINSLPDEGNCSYTSAGQTTLTADAYASRPGSNTFYIVAKDEAGNINYETYKSTSFSYSGTAPGIARNLDIADISIKSTQKWRLVLTWDSPANIGSGVSSYKVLRSITGNSCSSNVSSFQTIGTTSGTSYVDDNLQQQDYYYCIRACDSANNCSAVSSTATEYPTGKFTSPAELISGPDVSLVTTKRAVISWVTERESDTKIAYGKESDKYFEEESYKATQEVYHTVVLNSLDPDTVYYFRAKWTDEDGNTGESDELNFKTDPPPTIKDTESVNISVSSATIRFTSTNAASVKIYYGQSDNFGGLEDIGTSTQESTYSVPIEGLEDNTKYFYKINPIDIEGNEYEGTVLFFETLPRPRVSNIQIQEVKESAVPTVEVSWDTNTKVSSVLTVTNSQNPDDVKNTAVIDKTDGNHTQEIKDLEANTAYTLIIKITDTVGNTSQSDPVTFTTATDSRPPAIENQKVESTVIEATNVNDNPTAQLIVSWDTDEPASGRVEVGEGTGQSYTISVEEEGNTGNDNTNHVVTVPNLDPSKVYHLRSVSTDSAGNTAYSGDVVTLTPKATDSVFKILFGTLSNVFGFF